MNDAACPRGQPVHCSHSVLIYVSRFWFKSYDVQSTRSPLIRALLLIICSPCPQHLLPIIYTQPHRTYHLLHSFLLLRTPHLPTAHHNQLIILLPRFIQMTD